MAASPARVAISRRGFVRKEIEYTTKFDLEKQGSSRKPKSNVVDKVSLLVKTL